MTLEKLNTLDNQETIASVVIQTEKAIEKRESYLKMMNKLPSSIDSKDTDEIKRSEAQKDELRFRVGSLEKSAEEVYFMACKKFLQQSKINDLSWNLADSQKVFNSIFVERYKHVDKAVEANISVTKKYFSPIDFSDLGEINSGERLQTSADLELKDSKVKLKSVDIRFSLTKKKAFFFKKAENAHWPNFLITIDLQDNQINTKTVLASLAGYGDSKAEISENDIEFIKNKILGLIQKLGVTL